METYRNDKTNVLSEVEFKQQDQLEKINENVASLKESIITNVKNKETYESIEMIKVFDI